MFKFNYETGEFDFDKEVNFVLRKVEKDPISILLINLAHARSKAWKNFQKSSNKDILLLNSFNRDLYESLEHINRIKGNTYISSDIPNNIVGKVTEAFFYYCMNLFGGNNLFAVIPTSPKDDRVKKEDFEAIVNSSFSPLGFDLAVFGRYFLKNKRPDHTLALPARPWYKFLDYSVNEATIDSDINPENLNKCIHIGVEKSDWMSIINDIGIFNTERIERNEGSPADLISRAMLYK